MTESVIYPDAQYKELPDKNNMLNYSRNNSLGATHSVSVACPSTAVSCCAPTGNQLESPSAAGPFHRRRFVSFPGAMFSHDQFSDSLNLDPSVLLGSSNKENCFREGSSYSELGDSLWPGSQLSVRGGSQVNWSRYKTELCRPFQENGTCKYGDKCQFAHGMHELRSLSRHPKYKTELCRTFHTIGFCPYGPRCHFIHNAEERRGPPPLSVFNKMERPRLHHSFSFAGFPNCGSLQDSPTSITPPPMFSSEDLNDWQSNPFTYSNQEMVGLLAPCSAPPPASWPQGVAPPISDTPYFFQPTSENLPSLSDSLSDQESYQSSLGSQSGSESPLLDASRRLPIFSTLSVSDD